MYDFAAEATAQCRSNAASRPAPRMVAALLAAAAAAWLVWLVLGAEPARRAWALQLLLAAGGLLAAGYVVRQRRGHVPRNTAKLVALLPRVRAGEEPIEALSRLAAGELAPLVPLLQEMLRDVRERRAAVTALEAELRQKVASRTDALERAIGSLRHQATRDALTGLFNRRFLDTYLPQVVRRARARHEELCLLMVDVDHFKPLNDTLGHAAGDALLRSIGQLLRSTVRGEDVAFRCGGDEFVILLPGCDAGAGRVMADRLVSLTDALGKTVPVPLPPRLSIGIASLSSLVEQSPESLMAEADKQLYAVKAIHHAQSRRLERASWVCPLAN